MNCMLLSPILQLHALSGEGVNTMALGSQKKELEHLINNYKKIISDDNLLLSQQNKVIVGLQEENRQLRKLLDLYEACINKGIKIDFPDVTGGGKEKTDSGNIDFSDF